MSTIAKLIERFEQGATPRQLINEGYKRSTVYEAYRRYKARLEARKSPTVEVFKRLEEGKTLPKIVVETGLDPDKVKEIYNKWLELRKIDVNQPIVLKDIEELRKEFRGVLVNIQALTRAMLNTFNLVKCPTCGEYFLVGRTVRPGTTVTCPVGNHTFPLNQSHIVSLEELKESTEPESQ